MPSMKRNEIWKLSQRPNYVASLDKKYAYSEVPYIGEYYLVKIPADENLIEHVDYWGEGRIDTGTECTGFKDCYNVNHEYQLVSNGEDRDRKIPNRIPVISYINCDTSSYIMDDKVKNVTVMGAPINKSCARDISRMINNDNGKVVIYGFEENSADTRNLEEELQKKRIIFCPNYELPNNLTGLTLFDSHRAFINMKELSLELHYKVSRNLTHDAVIITQNLIKTGNFKTLTDTVIDMLKAGVKNTVHFAYKLFLTDKDIIEKYFPKEFSMIFNSQDVKIISKLHKMPLKLDTELDSEGDRLAWGDGVNSTKEKLLWKFIPITEDDKVFFKIENKEYSMMLKLATTADRYGDRLSWGDNKKVDDARLKFLIEVIKKDNDIIFIIFNKQFGQSLKLEPSTDANGNRRLWGNDYFVNYDYERFGWQISL